MYKFIVQIESPEWDAVFYAIDMLYIAAFTAVSTRKINTE